MSTPEVKRIALEEIEVVLPKEAIQRRVKELAAEIHADYQDKHLVLVILLKGAFVFGADLIRELGELGQSLSVEFIGSSSYSSGTESSRQPEITLDVLDEAIRDNNTLLVEDIVDTGYTFSFLLEHLARKDPASLKTAVLLSKSARREVEVPLDYLGFEIPDKFVVGYGLDHGEQGRQLPFVGVTPFE